MAGTTDVHLTQVLDYPGLSVNVDRQRAAYVGVTERDVANSLLTLLSSSSLVAPSYFLNPAGIRCSARPKCPATATATSTSTARPPFVGRLGEEFRLGLGLSATRPAASLRLPRD